MLIGVAISGGLDSLYALVSLKEQGHSLFAIHALLHGENSLEQQEKLQTLCDTLAVPLHFVDLRAAFEERVVQDFIQSYAQGSTPNPCARCNVSIKFGLLQDEAKKLGATHFATGHYASLIDHPTYGRVLKKASDNAKDQAYFLGLTPISSLHSALFPLADVQKEEAKDYLAKRGFFPLSSKESQDICFIPNEGYTLFLQERGLQGHEGPICLTDDTKLGRHKGLWHYTEGQRKGLGIAWKEPLYVIEKKLETNRLIVGTKDELFQKNVQADGLVCHVPPSLWPEELFVRLRYRQEAQKAKVVVDCLQNTLLTAYFDKPQQVAAAGQLLVVYDAEGIVLAAAQIISKS